MARKPPRTRDQVEFETFVTRWQIAGMLVAHGLSPLRRPLTWKSIQREFPHLSRSAIYWYLDQIHKDADSLEFV